MLLAADRWLTAATEFAAAVLVAAEVLLGALMELASLARAMIAMLVALLDHIRGGLQYALLSAMYLVSGISGAKAADMAAVAPALFPEMIKRGNREGDLTSLLSASAVMSETIPPSIVLITVGSVTGVHRGAVHRGPAAGGGGDVGAKRGGPDPRPCSRP